MTVYTAEKCGSDDANPATEIEIADLTGDGDKVKITDEYIFFSDSTQVAKIVSGGDETSKIRGVSGLRDTCGCVQAFKKSFTHDKLDEEAANGTIFEDWELLAPKDSQEYETDGPQCVDPVYAFGSFMFGAFRFFPECP